MLHDDSVYTQPEEFSPDRFSPSDENPKGEPDPARAVFGFGRRYGTLFWAHANPRLTGTLSQDLSRQVFRRRLYLAHGGMRVARVQDQQASWSQEP